MTCLSPTEASIVTEMFSGTGTLVSDNSGDHTGNSFTVVTTDPGTCVDISFEVTVAVTTTGGGPLHFDTRGFGDSGGSNDAFQASAESLQFTISVPTATLSSSAPAGSSIVSSSVVASFTSLDLVNNGSNPPSVTWTDNLNGMGTATAAAGTQSGDVTQFAVTSGATTVDVQASSAWSWINNAQFTYSGDVEVNKPETVPEPGSVALLVAGLGFLSTRRRRA